MDQGLHLFLVWLFSLQVDPFLLPILSLIFLPFKVGKVAVSSDVERKSLIPVLVGLAGALLLYSPQAIAQFVKTNSTELASWSTTLGATGTWYVGNTIVDTLGLEIVAIIFIIKTTGANQQWLRDLIKWCGILIVALLALYLGMRKGWV